MATYLQSGEHDQKNPDAMKRSHLIFLFLWVANAAIAQTSDSIYFKLQRYMDRVEVYVDSMFFTAYRHESTLEKAVLFPIHAPDGTIVTRGYPLDPRPEERVDHPHHVGLWFNFGDVNGYDFWNNSSALPEKRKGAYGRIIHRSIEQLESRGTSALLRVQLDWMAPDNEQAEKLLEESASYVFRTIDGAWIVDRITQLRAARDSVILRDNKEGMLAIRVDRAFEHPSQNPVILTDAKGKPSGGARIDNKGVTGWYTNSEGDEGMDAWGKNASWVRLTGTKGDSEYSLVLMDHPENINYPSCWHARGYGLFSVNNLGRQVFNKKLDKLQLIMDRGDILTFRHRFVVAKGHLSKGEVEAFYEDFVSELR
jgi:hypothetical protein